VNLDPYRCRNLTRQTNVKTYIMKLFVITFLFILSLATIACADSIQLSNFTREGLAGWERKSFEGTTEYSLVRDGDRAVVRARSRAAASGLYRKVSLDPQQYRYLSWSWKVAGPLNNSAEKTKGGDDYTARVYVVFPGFFFWQTKAINYVWAGSLPKGDSYPNPYTHNAMMVVAESGPEKAGVWVSERHDILADYRRLFGAEPGSIGAIAIMTDTDNTGLEATAWYSDIFISSSP